MRNMRTQSNPFPHRAAALLIVLVALILVVTASTTIARIASTVKVRRQFDARIVRADDLLEAAEQPILHWLNTKSASIVLPLDAAQPSADVLHDWIVIGNGDDDLRLRIQAFDQCGMAPIEVARSGSPVRLALPQDVLSALDQLILEPGQKPGLDLIVQSTSGGDENNYANDLAVFPDCRPVSPICYGEQAIEQNETSYRSDLAPQTGPQSAIGSSIATHNPGLININTAPIDLVEAAMRASNTGGLEQVIQARAMGKLASAPSSAQDGSQTDGSLPLKLQMTSSSPAWSFRIDIEVGPLHRSWWAVYVRNGSQWECAQRLAITQ